MTIHPSRILPLLFCAFTLSVFAQTKDTGISIPNMDPAVHPGDDFYLYANGGFIARTKLPPDRASVGVFNALSDRSFEQVANIISDATKSNAPAGSGAAACHHATSVDRQHASGTTAGHRPQLAAGGAPRSGHPSQ